MWRRLRNGYKRKKLMFSIKRSWEIHYDAKRLAKAMVEKNERNIHFHKGQLRKTIRKKMLSSKMSYNQLLGIEVDINYFLNTLVKHHYDKDKTRDVDKFLDENLKFKEQ